MSRVSPLLKEELRSRVWQNERSLVPLAREL